MPTLVRIAGVDHALPERPQLGEVRRASELMSPPLPRQQPDLENEIWSRALQLVSIALGRTTTPLTSDDMLSSEMTPDELWTGQRVVLSHFGMLREPKPGEDLAGAAPPGPGSMENFAPA